MKIKGKLVPKNRVVADNVHYGSGDVSAEQPCN